MRSSRTLLLVTSIVVTLVVLGGGVAVKVRAQDNSYRDSVIFAEILSLVLENYVDPVEGDGLLQGAYEGLLAGLDPNGAYLTPEEVRTWKAGGPDNAVDPGISVLKIGRLLQIVSLDPGSSAEENGLELGDQIRTIDGRIVTDLSLGQCRQLLQGEPGTKLEVEVLQRNEEFRPTVFELERAVRRGEPFTLEIQGAVAVLRVTDLARLRIESLDEELGDIGTRGVTRLLIDLRNLADSSPRDAAEVAALFSTDSGLVLKRRDGKIVDTVETMAKATRWPGEVSILVNGATAGGGEALAQILQVGLEAEVYGESTFGLGAEPELLELDNGAGLLVSVARWETNSGDSWNETGVEPDQEVRGRGETYADAAADQLSKVLELMEHPEDEKAEAA